MLGIQTVSALEAPEGREGKPTVKGWEELALDMEIARDSTQLHDDLRALTLAGAVGDGALGRGAGGGATARAGLGQAVAARAKLGTDQQKGGDADNCESCQLLPVHTPGT